MKTVKVIALITVALAMFALLALPSCQHDLVYNTPLTPIDTNTNPIDTNHIDTLHCDTCAAGVISFSEDVLPILQSNCALSGCHDAITHEKGLNTTSYTSLMNSNHSPSGGLGSDFWHAMSGGGGDPMPPTGPLTASQLLTIQT